MSYPQELLQMVPQPVVAVLFLFPVTKESEAAKDTGTFYVAVPALSKYVSYIHISKAHLSSC